MDKIDILQKHYSTFKELKAKKAPKEPKKPVEPELEKEKESLSYKKKYSAWVKRLEDFRTKYEQWEKIEQRTSNIRQIKISSYGFAQAGSAHRLVRLGGILNEVEDDYFLGTDGKSYPDFDRIVDSLQVAKSSLFLDVSDFKKSTMILEKACETATFEYITKDDESYIEFIPLHEIKEPLEKATVKINNWQDAEPLKFGINTRYLNDVFKLASSLNIQMIELQFISSVMPVRFVAKDFYYLVTPIRIS